MRELFRTHFCQLFGVQVSDTGEDLLSGRKEGEKRSIFSEKAVRQNCYDSHSTEINK